VVHYFNRYNRFTSHKVTYKSSHIQRLIIQGIFLDLAAKSETLPVLENFWFTSKDGIIFSFVNLLSVTLPDV